MNKEKTILHYMNTLGISKEEAEQLFEDDLNDFIGDEGEKMTAAAKQTQHRERSDKPRTITKPKERKVDATKKKLFDYVVRSLESLNDLTVTNVKTETEITFLHNGETYTWKLTKHRPKK